MDRGRQWSGAARGAIGLLILFTGACGTRLEDAKIRAAAGPGEASRPVASPGLVGGGGVAPDASLAGPAVAPAAGGSSSAGATAVTGGAAATPSVAGQTAQAGPLKAVRAGSAAGGATTGGGSAAAGGAMAGGSASPGPPGAAAGAAPTGPSAPGGGPAPATAAAAGSPVVLGHIGDYSGVVGTVLKGSDVTAQVVARHINDTGGLNGHPVKVITADAGGDPSRAVSLARDLVEAKGAIAFVGNMWVFSGAGARDYLEARKIPVIGGDSTTPVWNQSPMYFPVGGSEAAVATGALDSLVQRNKKKIGVVYCVEAEQCKIWQETAEKRAAKAGAQIVYRAQVSLAQPDFTAECLGAQRNGAEGLMAGVDGPSIRRLARACSQQGYRPQYVTANLAVIESIAQDPALDGLIAPIQTFPYMADDLPGAQEYQAAIKRYAPTLASSPATSMVWVSGALLRQVSRALPASPKPADFLAGLYQVKNDSLGGLTGALTYVEGKPTPDIPCYFLIQVAGGHFTAPDGSRSHCF